MAGLKKFYRNTPEREDGSGRWGKLSNRVREFTTTMSNIDKPKPEPKPAQSVKHVEEVMSK